MSSPIVAHRDRTAIRQAISHLPHALLIVAEPGLDGAGVAEQIARSAPSDVVRLTPQDGKSAISTEQIRDLTASLRTHSPTRRVIIIDPADTMTESAQNALLKNLEEPGAGTHFILISASTDQLLSTIRSRCQTLTLHRTSPTQDETLLLQAGLSAAERQQILFLAAGRPLLIKELAHNPQRLAAYQALAADAKLILSPPNPYDALVTALKYTSREDALMLIDILLNFIRFQLRSNPTDRQLHKLADRTVSTEAALRANGNIRLALTKLVV